MTATPRGAPGRVAAVHHQTRRGLLVTTGFVAAAVVAAVARGNRGWWLPVHLFAVGGLLSAISTTTQMLAVTWSAAPAPRPVMSATQRWLLAAGAVAATAGRELSNDLLFAIGSALVVISLLGLAALLWQVRSQAVTPRFHPALEAYLAAALLGAAGTSLGYVVGGGHAGRRFVELRGAHLLLNLFGLVGLVVAATLPYFVATQLRTKMSSRATPAVVRSLAGGLVIAALAAVGGRAIDSPWLAAAGLLAYGLGIVGVVALLPVFGRGRLRWAGPRAIQLLLGVAWWIGMTFALAAAALRDTDDRPILLALVIGGFAQILVASLAYLGPVVRGGGHEQLTSGFRLTRSWVSLAAGNLAPVAALLEWWRALAAVLVVWLVDLLMRAVALVGARRAVSG